MYFTLGTIHHGLLLRKSHHLHIQAFADADWGSDPDDRKSTTGYTVYLGINLISWSSLKQKVVSRSSTEVEYRSVAAALANIKWVSNLLQELHLSSSTQKIYLDNQ